MFLWLPIKRDCCIHMYFQLHCKLYHYRLIRYVSDHLPCLSFVLFPYSCLFFKYPHWVASHSIFCGQTLFLSLSLMCVGCLYHNHGTTSNFCCYIFSPLDQLATWVSVFSLVYMYVLPFFPFTSLFRVSCATLMLHISACSSQI